MSDYVEVMQGLRYIASSPRPESGGFHPEAIRVCGDAVKIIERFQHMAHLWSITREALIAAGCPITDSCHVPSVLEAWLRYVRLTREREMARVCQEEKGLRPPPEQLETKSTFIRKKE